MGLMQPLIVDSDGNRVFCDECEHGKPIIEHGFYINGYILCPTRKSIINGEEGFCERYQPKENK